MTDIISCIEEDILLSEVINHAYTIETKEIKGKKGVN